MKNKLRIICILLVFMLVFSLTISAESPTTMTKEEIIALLNQNPELKGAPHTHDNTRFFSEAGTVWGYCLDCGASVTPPLQLSTMPMGSQVVLTSQAIRNSCMHDYGYYTLGADDHHAICSLCGYAFVESHNITAATCTTHEHCHDCGHHEGSWEDALGHSMGYDSDFLNGTHTLRCMRADNDAQFMCDHIEEADVPCSWGESWVDSEYDGEHYIWQNCTACGNMNYVGSYTCTGPGSCVYPH